jgi:hypothetical protein
MKPLTVADIREAKRQLMSVDIKPLDGLFYASVAPPRLTDGIVWMGLCTLHPSTFLDVFGPEEFLAMKTDISKRRMETYVRLWQRRKNKIAEEMGNDYDGR